MINEQVSSTESVSKPQASCKNDVRTNASRQTGYNAAGTKSTAIDVQFRSLCRVLVARRGSIELWKVRTKQRTLFMYRTTDTVATTELLVHNVVCWFPSLHPTTTWKRGAGRRLHKRRSSNKEYFTGKERSARNQPMPFGTTKRRTSRQSTFVVHLCYLKEQDTAANQCVTSTCCLGLRRITQKHYNLVALRLLIQRLVWPYLRIN